MSRRAGFSLIEVLGALSLLAVLLALSLSLLSPRKSASSARLGAELIASILRDTRQSAVTNGLPSAVGLPTQGGTQGVADSCYQLVGRENPKLTRVVKLASESANCQLFLGSYPGPSWSSVRPSGLLDSPNVPAGWNPQGSNDPILLFWPNGTVTSNLPHDGGEYRFVVGQNLAAAGGQLSAAYLPYTVSVSLLGSIDTQPGIPGANAALTLARPFSSSAAGSVSRSFGPNHSPSLVAPYLEVSPPVQASTLADVSLPGSTVTVALDGSLTLETFAQDPDGDRLLCKWWATGPRPDSRFSHPLGNAMEWDSGRNCWISRWSFFPPPSANPGEQYTLHCEVSDGRGGTTGPADVGVQLPVASTLSTRKIVYVEGNYWALQGSLWTVNWDGTNPVEIVSRASLADQGYALSDGLAAFSPDGRVLAFGCVNITNANDGGVWVCSSSDGANLRRLTRHNDSFEGLCWDPAGRYLYTQDSDLDGTQYLQRWEYSDALDTTYDELARWPHGGNDELFFDIHPSGQFIVKSFPTDLKFIWLATATTPARVISLPGAYSQACFSADGNSIFTDQGGCIRRYPIAWNAAAQTVNLAGPQSDVTPGFTNLESPMASRDGQYLTGQVVGSPMKSFLVKLATGELMPLTIPGSTNADGSRFGP